jgi:hypothetical protein
MSDWKRTTREVAFEQFSEDVKTEIQRHIRLYNLGEILEDALICIETDSEKPKKGLFGSAESVRQCAIVTPHWLVWSVRDQKSLAALSALLRDIVLQDYGDTPLAKMLPDSGIQVTGKFTDVSENASAFLGLEANAVGEKFKDVVIRAVQYAKK